VTVLPLDGAVVYPPLQHYYLSFLARI